MRCSAIQRTNANLPKGSLENDRTRLFVGANDSLRTPKDFAPLIIKEEGGRILRLSDVAVVRDGMENEKTAGFADGKPAVNESKCIGCRYCSTACPFDVPRLNPEDNRVYKCTLCVDRVVVGQEPACVKTCPTGAIHFGTKESMKTLASERVAELKTRGYDNAGLYDPAGVGGTHVMYVLHHADKPNLYHGLPENPEISETVKFWKGIWKPLAAVGFAATFAASIFHYVGVGPNRADEEENNLHEEKDEERK